MHVQWTSPIIPKILHQAELGYANSNWWEMQIQRGVVSDTAIYHVHCTG